MTQEEKARRYDEALERARKSEENSNGMILKKWLWNIFPELKESEDEKIRKEIMQLIQGMHDADPRKERWLSWLEKQGEQKETLCDKCRKEQPSHSCQDITALGRCAIEKPDDKIEPTDYNSIDPHFGKPIDKVESKFKVGDWITDGYLHCKISDILDDRYIIDKKFAKRSAIPFICESNYHLWTIQDAKDGDVLAENKEGVILIFRGIGNTEWDDVIDYHCYYDCYRKNFILQDDVDHWGDIKNNQLKPATKEQRDLLFTKMKEAGYMWDEEKKELKKFAKFKVGDWIINNDVYGDVPVKIKEIGNYLYLCERQDGVIIELNKDAVLKEFKHWDITDAKDGDVLAVDSKPFIYNGSKNEVTVGAYCGFNTKHKFSFAYNYVINQNITPATKEQRDLLFTKMKEAGYIFDFDNKELKKIEQEPIQEMETFEAEHGKYYYCIKDYFSGGRKQASKGDVVQALRGLPIMGLKDASEYFFPVNFIKCNSAWSEDDKEMIDKIIDYMQPMPIFFESTKGKSGKEYTKKFVKDATKWLKSLKHQNAWKPTDGQIKALKEACDKSWEPDGLDLLWTLYEDLEKLKGG